MIVLNVLSMQEGSFYQSLLILNIKEILNIFICLIFLSICSILKNKLDLLQQDSLKLLFIILIELLIKKIFNGLSIVHMIQLLVICLLLWIWLMLLVFIKLILKVIASIIKLALTNIPVSVQILYSKFIKIMLHQLIHSKLDTMENIERFHSVIIHNNAQLIDYKIGMIIQLKLIALLLVVDFIMKINNFIKDLLLFNLELFLVS